MNLPQNSNLPINLLASCFNSTSATYKFYWFIAILENIKEGKFTIPYFDIFVKMICNAWYTVNYFKVSFGKQDLIQKHIKSILNIENLTIDIDKKELEKYLLNTKNNETINLIYHFIRQVPHWFLSPWFPNDNKTTIYQKSQNFENDCLYALFSDKVIFNPIWINYLQKHLKILYDFTYWNLTLFLQSRNPNVPDIPNKLIKPVERLSLTKQRNLWNSIFEKVGTIECIYTGKMLTKKSYHLDHFVPYSFVIHNLMWNLIPADTSINSSKNDRLPKPEIYFDKYFTVQKQTLNFLKDDNNNKLIEDYLTIIPDINMITGKDSEILKDKFYNTVIPLITIAANNGFQYMA